jgi:hypothetical protein
MKITRSLSILIALFLFSGILSPLYAQVDSTLKKDTVNSFFKRQKGLVGKLARNFVADTTTPASNGPIRNDIIFSRYEGRIIRRIKIERIDFGVSINDTSEHFNNHLTNLANKFHHKSREYVIRNNLFFKVGDPVLPYLLSDNERHLRDQAYLQDAKIILRRVPGSQDSVDVIVRTKDVLSIGGSFTLHNTRSADMSIKEDNLEGWGNQLQLSTLYDMDRRRRGGYGIDYINRNIGGSFIDGYAGYSDFASAFNSGQRQETKVYGQLIKPLVNPYTRWTYSMQGEYHTNSNMYFPDSLYNSDHRYRYYNYDAWVGLNTDANKLVAHNEYNRLRKLVSIRYLKQQFLVVPGKYANQYSFRYADLTGVLGSFSIFKQNFYKTKYIYGFGRNEDVPEGVDISLTTGWTNKQGLNRPYMGLDVQRYYFALNESYLHFTLRAGSYMHAKRLEDIDLLFNTDYFSRLVNLGPKWKQRSFLSAGITGQVNPVLNEPLFLESSFGLPEYRNGGIIGGDIRSTIKGETVFYSPYNFLNFRFAPFIFGNMSMITPQGASIGKSDVYSSIGAGIRTRNESLIFGTFEFKAYYFPNKNFYGDSWRLETSTNIKFKYNSQFIKRPELISVN